MRITAGNTYNSYLNNLEEIQSRRYTSQIRISTGKQITTLSDDPRAVVSIKELNDIIERNKQYKTNIANALDEMQATHDSLQSTADLFQNMRQLAIDSTQTGNIGNLPSLATTLKGYIEDVIRNMNQDVNGQYLFGGSKSTKQSIQTDFPGSNGNPYEITTVPATTANPSGMTIVFHGNMADKSIHKDANTTEVVNMNTEQIMGTGGTQFFDAAVKLYNLLKYKSDGTPRGDKDLLTLDDRAKLDQYQSQINDYYNKLNSSTGIMGSRIERLKAFSDQYDNEEIRLNSLKSEFEDSDVARESMNLAKDDTSLQYSLQVGSKMMSSSLFDFVR